MRVGLDRPVLPPQWFPSGSSIPTRSRQGGQYVVRRGGVDAKQGSPWFVVLFRVDQVAPPIQITSLRNLGSVVHDMSLSE